ncbi:MAG: twin-arginine translocation signal domain-containing protein, partial [Burkholderiales bacterium]|nr:twin-arginine translocation signal domain-containing protein [Burkholderiales bacterium]
MVSRRKFISLTAAGAGAILVSPQLVFANVQTEHRFVFVIQRGAADGLSTVVPYGDPAYAGLRAELAIDAASAIKLNGLFVLHPSMVETGRMYAAGQALFVHAVASPYRQRSHFDGQNVLESGGTAPYQLKDGWLNRLVTLLPATREGAIALAPTVPLALRGRVEVASYAPSALPSAPDDLLMR